MVQNTFSDFKIVTVPENLHMSNSKLNMVYFHFVDKQKHINLLIKYLMSDSYV